MHWLTYEFPLNERVRTWLRFDRLFAKYHQALADEHSPFWSWQAFQVLMEITDVAERSDLKSDILKEQTRLHQYFELLNRHQDVDRQVLQRMEHDNDTAMESLRNMPGRPGQYLNNFAWFNLLHTRMGIPGGCNDFDVPSFHWWQQLPDAQKKADIQHFFGIFAPLEKSIQVVLLHIRESAENIEVTAHQGAAAVSSSNRVVLVQVGIEPQADFFPEVSANRFQINIRLLQLHKLSWENKNLQASPKIIVRPCVSPVDSGGGY